MDYQRQASPQSEPFAPPGSVEERRFLNGGWGGGVVVVLCDMALCKYNQDNNEDEDNRAITTKKPAVAVRSA